ncbi:MAG: tRNA uridine-5-carboxymethylaminomethyl(34) synthesis enzyme MnmG [Clostridia bacterium]|nr:tRNA uridine-5-carboxymethylaminomethyl(34) synthesis enzyme MnmG [Clostridia bacterium]
MNKNFDIIVIGAGHAGIEAAFAAARKGHTVLLVTLSLNSIGFMACNPNIGGTAKGNLVCEIDALGGVMGEVADRTTIQTRMLNRANGPAVHSLRAQVDKAKYHSLMKVRLEREPRITLLESEVKELLTQDKQIKGIKTALGDVYNSSAVILTTGVYLESKIIIGEYSQASGPQGFLRSEGLTACLKSLGLPVRRFKTGTPPRVLAKSIDFSQMEAQAGDKGIPKFSVMTDYAVENSHKCYLTYTNESTHKIILENLSRAPLFNGSIEGAGPRYCPSVEDKIVRFKDKERHQIFIEPEGADTEEMYVQGLSTSMPFDVQEKMVHSVKGLENAIIVRYGYAIEYDCIDPQSLLPTLAVKGLQGLFAAGQINGTSGYEEAGAQGLIAGANAALYLEGKPPFVLKRDEAYIGVLIDDLVTKGTAEPYRMMTSRAEYRLFLRQDNADLRLTQRGYDIGLVDEQRYQRLKNKTEAMSEIKQRLNKSYAPQAVEEAFAAKNEPLPKGGIKGRDILKRSALDKDDLIAVDPTFREVDYGLLTQVETEIKYEGYLQKQEASIKEARRMEERALFPDIDYSKIDGLRNEAKQKLNKVKPLNLAQAARISGVNPADIVVLMIWLSKNKI